jgi:hypothetical protein
MLGFPDPVNLQGHAGQFAFTLIDGITKALNSGGAGKIASALIAKIGQEVALAKNVSSAAMQGQGFGNAGLIGGMDPTQGSVADQMTSYLKSVQSFTKDIAALRKGHLNKAIISQLIGAGPVAGDALAQNILGAGTTTGSGVGQVNKLWAQLGQASKGLGAQAAMAQYGTVAPNLRSAGVVNNNVSISVSMGGGQGGDLSTLTAKQMKTLVEQIQAALLKQAHRNRKTGVAVKGKGA